ncbi:MAG TPA: hypothetical protein VKV74_02850 [Bryobacteraceae bacterium]|nr:hypothetical protein [Bryobacteraceae bacterium]
MAGVLSVRLALAQGVPVVTGPNGAAAVAFWYLGGITPGCCNDGAYYYTQSVLYLQPNTTDPNPSVQWITDSPSKVQITPQGGNLVLLTALGHSSPGTNYDIHVTAVVDGVSSAPFPVYINTPWVQSGGSPSSVGCFYYPETQGWQVTVNYTVTNLQFLGIEVV